MADTTGHTPLPWTIGRGRRWITSGEVDIARIHDVSKIGEDEAVANAEFIVRACNSHYDLLDALETLLNMLPDSNMGEIGVTANTMHDIIITAEDAIAKAKGGDTANIRI